MTNKNLIDVEAMTTEQIEKVVKRAKKIMQTSQTNQSEKIGIPISY